jgi:hypothetical protein
MILHLEMLDNIFESDLYNIFGVIISPIFFTTLFFYYDP